MRNGQRRLLLSAMNELNVSLQHSIMTLSAQGWSNRRIARELGLHRETVGRHLRLAVSKPAKVPPGILPLFRSQCEPWREFIEQGCQAGLSAQRLYQDLVTERQFGGSYDAVKRFVRRWTQTQPVPFVRMEVEPGAEAQIDFGQGAWVMVNGKRKRPHLFRVPVMTKRRWVQTRRFDCTASPLRPESRADKAPRNCSYSEPHSTPEPQPRSTPRRPLASLASFRSAPASDQAFSASEISR